MFNNESECGRGVKKVRSVINSWTNILKIFTLKIHWIKSNKCCIVFENTKLYVKNSLLENFMYIYTIISRVFYFSKKKSLKLILNFKPSNFLKRRELTAMSISPIYRQKKNLTTKIAEQHISLYTICIK